MQVTDMLYSKGLEDALLKKEPPGVTKSIWEKMDYKALGIIWLTLPMSIVSHVMKETTMWSLLIDWLVYMKNP